MVGSIEAAGAKKERRSVIPNASSHRIKINRTSLDHLLLGESTDSDKRSHALSITPELREVARVFNDRGFGPPVMCLVGA
jgi:hypothetical protein